MFFTVWAWETAKVYVALMIVGAVKWAFTAGESADLAGHAVVWIGVVPTLLMAVLVVPITVKVALACIKARMEA